MTPGGSLASSKAVRSLTPLAVGDAVRPEAKRQAWETQVSDRIAINRLTLLAWVAVLAASGFLAVDTVATIQRTGLVGTRPPLAGLQTGLRIAIIVVALGLLYVCRNILERVTLLMGAAAAGSSALYGFGLRSPGLSAFRLLSHLAAYVLAMIVAGRMILVVRRQLTTRNMTAGREA